MIEETIRIGIDQIVEAEEFNLGVEFSMDKITERDLGMNKTIGVIIGEEILEATWECIKIRILEDKTIEVDKRKL